MAKEENLRKQLESLADSCINSMNKMRVVGEKASSEQQSKEHIEYMRELIMESYVYYIRRAEAIGASEKYAINILKQLLRNSKNSIIIKYLGI